MSVSLTTLAPLYRRMREVHPGVRPVAIVRYLLAEDARKFADFIHGAI
jgi:hypothetical protein